MNFHFPGYSFSGKFVQIPLQMETSNLREKLRQLIDAMDEQKVTALYKALIADGGLYQTDAVMAGEDPGKYTKTDGHLQELIFVVGETASGEFTAQALGFSIHTEADSIEELRTAVRDAVNCHFDDEQKRIIRLHIVKEEVIAA